jgi:hypothetical protein
VVATFCVKEEGRLEAGFVRLAWGRAGRVGAIGGYDAPESVFVRAGLDKDGCPNGCPLFSVPRDRSQKTEVRVQETGVRGQGPRARVRGNPKHSNPFSSFGFRISIWDFAFKISPYFHFSQRVPVPEATPETFLKIGRAENDKALRRQRLG